MTNILETALTSVILAESGKAISKVRGRRNYSIRMEMVDRKAYVGGFGMMDSRGLLGEFLYYMAEHGTTWAHFTYKKDFMAAVNALENNGFKIIWLQ